MNSYVIYSRAKGKDKYRNDQDFRKALAKDLVQEWKQRRHIPQTPQKADFIVPDSLKRTPI